MRGYGYPCCGCVRPGCCGRRTQTLTASIDGAIHIMNITAQFPGPSIVEWHTGTAPFSPVTDPISFGFGALGGISVVCSSECFQWTGSTVLQEPFYGAAGGTYELHTYPEPFYWHYWFELRSEIDLGLIEIIDVLIVE